MKFSDFKDEKAIEVVADLLVPIANIASNPDNSKAKGKSPIHFASSVLKNNPKDVKSMLAILNDVPENGYHCNAITIMNDVLEMFSDPELMQLFGLQSKTQTSLGSASENTEVGEQ